jgi:hypothetical protein
MLTVSIQLYSKCCVSISQVDVRAVHLLRALQHQQIVQATGCMVVILVAHISKRIESLKLVIALRSDTQVQLEYEAVQHAAQLQVPQLHITQLLL